MSTATGFCFDDFGLLLLLFAVDRVLEPPLLIFDRDLTIAFLSHLDVRAAHGIGRAFGFDLVDHIVIGKCQVLR